MPFVPRLFVKAGIAYLALTFLAGAVLLSPEAVGKPVPFIVGVEHGHMGFVGWLVNTVIGVALWLLPLNRKAFPATQGRYPETLARVSFFMLNIGLPMRLIFEPIDTSSPSILTKSMLLGSALLQAGAIVIVASIAWRRVYPPPLRPDV